MRPAKAAAPVVSEAPAAKITLAIAPRVEAAPEVTVEEPADADLPDTIQETLLQVCEAKGYGEACAKTLLGMLWKESMGKANAIGDRGKARGWFQIWVKLHKIPVECAEDLRCSAEWSLTYMERNGYPKYPTYATQCHNGCNARNGYAASVKRHGDRLWSKPMLLAVK